MEENKQTNMLKTSSAAIKDLQKYFLLGVLILLLIMAFRYISIFFVDLLIAGVIVAAVYPAYKHLKKALWFSKTLAAVLAFILIIVIILLPFVAFVLYLIGQAPEAYVAVSTYISESIADNGGVDTPTKIISILPFSDQVNWLLGKLPFSPVELIRNFQETILTSAGALVGDISTFLIRQSTNIIKHLTLFILHVIIFLMTLFYFLRDGDRLVIYLKSLLPMSQKYRDELFTKMSNLSYGIIYGIFGTAIAQGILVGLGFTFTGLDNAVFWGSIAALFSPVPYIGTAIVWLPAVFVLAFGGSWLMALLLLIWCVLVVGTADNIIKPFLIGSSAALHPLAMLLVILGGTFTIGLQGLIFGPFILTLALAFLHIYKLEYQSVLEERIEEPKREPINPVKKLKELKKRYFK